jgi:hypothetical protein
MTDGNSKAENSKPAIIIHFAFQISVITQEFVTVGRFLNALNGATAVLEAEAEIVCTVEIAMRR